MFFGKQLFVKYLLSIDFKECKENIDCGEGGICYFKPEGEIGSCIYK